MTTAPSLGSGPLDLERLRPFAQRVAATWADLPAGGQVEVHRPGADELVVVDGSDAGAFVPLRRGVVEVIAPGRDRDGRPLHRRIELDRRVPDRRRGRAQR